MKNYFALILITVILLTVSGCIQKTEYMDASQNQEFLLYYSFTANQVLEYLEQTTIHTLEKDPKQITQSINYIPKLIGNPVTLEILTTDSNRTLFGTEADYLNKNSINNCGDLPINKKDYLIQMYPNGETIKNNIQSTKIYLPAYPMEMGEKWKFNSVNYAFKEEIQTDFNGTQISAIKIELFKKTETENWNGTALFDHQNHRLLELNLEKQNTDTNTSYVLKLLNIQDNTTTAQLNKSCLNQVSITQ